MPNDRTSLWIRMLLSAVIFYLVELIQTIIFYCVRMDRHLGVDAVFEMVVNLLPMFFSLTVTMLFGAALIVWRKENKKLLLLLGGIVVFHFLAINFTDCLLFWYWFFNEVFGTDFGYVVKLTYARPEFNLFLPLRF